jgi:hypothetical protein
LASFQLPSPDTTSSYLREKLNPQLTPFPSPVATYRAATWVSNKIVDECSELDRLCAWALTAPEPQLRWLLVHVFEETARHAGQADIFGVQIDGQTGR